MKKRVEVGTLMQHTGPLSCAEFFERTHLLTGSTDNTICIWRVSDWNCVHILGGHKAMVNSIAIHPTGKLALSVSKDRTLRMWNLIKGRSAFIRRLEAEATQVFFSPDGLKYGLLSGRTVSIFDVENNQVLCKLSHDASIHAARFVSNDLVVSMGEINAIMVWNVSGKLLAEIQNEELKTRIRDFVVLPKPDALLIVLAGTNGSVQVWDLSQADLEENDNVKQVDLKPVVETKVGGGRITCISAIKGGSTAAEEKVVAPSEPESEEEEKDSGETNHSRNPRITIDYEDNTTSRDSKKQKKN